MGLRYLLRNDIRRPRRVAVTDEASDSGADVEGKELLDLLVTAQGVRRVFRIDRGDGP